MKSNFTALGRGDQGESRWCGIPLDCRLSFYFVMYFLMNR